MSLQLVLQNLREDHDAIEGGQGSPYLTHMEEYYLTHTNAFRAKIMMADWIPRDVRRHMIEHIENLLRQRAGGRARVKRVSFRQLVRDPAVVKVQTKRYTYVKDKRGRITKHSKKDGRFVAFSQKERREVQRNRGRKV